MKCFINALSSALSKFDRAFFKTVLHYYRYFIDNLKSYAIYLRNLKSKDTYLDAPRFGDIYLDEIHFWMPFIKADINQRKFALAY